MPNRFLRLHTVGKSQPMTLAERSWQRGREDAHKGRPCLPPIGMDASSYNAGFVDAREQVRRTQYAEATP